MLNGSFVFGMDEDDPTVFDRTVEWAVAQGIETATFHVLTPHPVTALHARMRHATHSLCGSLDETRADVGLHYPDKANRPYAFLLEAVLEGTDKGSSREGLASRRATSFPRATATVGPEDVLHRIRRSG
jgi:hypothetical protein